MVGALAAVEQSLDAPDHAAATVREFAAMLICKLADGGWARARLAHRAHPAVLVDALHGALGHLDAVRRPRAAVAPARALTDEQELYAAAPLEPRASDHELLIVRA
mmetsp:Transcript_20530/g.70896  ORF Transcript_20530/g.70896 Transcript_20530/m.70896 type:complete len:106 (-) Transcript_20530:865-1182(-)